MFDQKIDQLRLITSAYHAIVNKLFETPNAELIRYISWDDYRDDFSLTCEKEEVELVLLYRNGCWELSDNTLGGTPYKSYSDFKENNIYGLAEVIATDFVNQLTKG